MRQLAVCLRLATSRRYSSGLNFIAASNIQTRAERPTTRARRTRRNPSGPAKEVRDDHLEGQHRCPKATANDACEPCSRDRYRRTAVPGTPPRAPRRRSGSLLRAVARTSGSTGCLRLSRCLRRRETCRDRWDCDSNREFQSLPAFRVGLVP